MNTENVVIILAKKPSLVNTKTRIAQATSPTFAKELALASLKDLINNIQNSSEFDLLIATDSENDLDWFHHEFSLKGFIFPANVEKGLTYRIGYSFSHVFENFYKKAVLVPMDMPFLNSNELISAFIRLDHNEFVVGPENNGGIYLIGVRQSSYTPQIFDNVKWSTVQSCETLINNMGKKRASYLKTKQDLNTFPDILNSKEEIMFSCPHLYHLLSQQGYYTVDKNFYVDFDDLDINIPTVSVLIENIIGADKYILLQTRAKKNIDPVYSGKLELPSGLIERYEEPIKAAIREVYEETGINLSIDDFDYEKLIFNGKAEDRVILIKPFCVTQQVKGGRAYINFTLIAHLRNFSGELKENKFETAAPKWFTLDEVAKIIQDPDNIFLINLPAIHQYLAENETYSDQ